MPLHKDFQQIYNKMRATYKGKVDKNGDPVFPGVFYAWVKKHGYDDTKKFPGNKEAIVYENILEAYLDDVSELTQESVTDNVINESKVKEMSKKGILPEGLQLYKFKTYAAYPTKSANKRNYSKSVLMEAAHKWSGKPFIFDHDAENSEKVTGIISESSYRTDSFDGDQPKEGVWMTGVGAMSHEMFVKVHGIKGFMPSIIKGGSIGAGGKAHPTQGGEQDEVDMDVLSPMEYSITAFPGIGNAEVRYEPVFLESVMSVRESAIQGKQPEVSEAAFKSITIFVNESENNVTLNNSLGGELTKMTDNKELNPATNIITNNTPTIEAKPIIEPTAPVKEDLNVSVTVSKTVNVSDPQGDEPASVVVDAAKDLLCDHDEDKEPHMEAKVSPTEAKSVMPKEEKPSPTPANLFPKDNPPNPTPAGYPDNNSQNSSTPAHPPEVNDADATLDQEIEDVVDELIPEYEMVYDEAKKKWVQKMHMKKGALHAQMGVPAGQKIPHSRLVAAAKKGGTLGRRARLALTMAKWHHRSKETVADILSDEALMKQLVPEIMKMVSEEEPEPVDGSGSTDNPKEQPKIQHGTGDGKTEEPKPTHGTGDGKVVESKVVDGDSQAPADMGADGAVDGTKSKPPVDGTKHSPATGANYDGLPAPESAPAPEVKVAEKVEEVTKAPITEAIPDTVPLKGDVPTLNTSNEPTQTAYKSITEVADAYYKLYGNQKDAYARVQAEILMGKWAHLKRAGEF